MRFPSYTALLLSALLGSACREPPRTPPDAEFLVVAGDSTWWVQSGRGGLRVRGAPITLAQVNGRFQEVFVTDDDRSFENAVFVAPLVFRRDLLTGDSALVWRDREFDAAVARYAAAHPGERRLELDEESPEEPQVSQSAEFGLVDLHGPYLSYEYHADVDMGDAPAWHSTRRGVVDLQTGGDATLAGLFGDSVAGRVLREGRRAYLAALDSVSRSHGEGARRVARALGDFRFDDGSFALTDLDGGPAIEFHAPGRGDGTSGGVTLPLDPLPVREPAWWRRLVRPELPVVSATTGHERWTRGAQLVEARYDSLGESATLVLVERGGTEWPIARVGAPVYRIHWLGSAALDSVGRRRLARAFDEASLSDEEVRIVSRHRHRGERSIARQVAAPRPRAPHRTSLAPRS